MVIKAKELIDKERKINNNIDMNDLIKSLEERLLQFDKASRKRSLTLKETKKKENLEFDCYWAKFRNLKAEFESLLFNDVNELVNSLETSLLKKDVLLKTETHVRNSRRYFGPDLPIYMIISFGQKSVGLTKRWENSPFLLFKNNQDNDSIEIYDCNQEVANVSEVIESNAWGNPIAQIKVEEYKFSFLKKQIEKWLKRNINRIYDI